MTRLDPTPNLSVRHWLKQGWNDFLATKSISIGFSAIYTCIGLFAYLTLIPKGLGMVVFPLLTGFLVVAPILVTGYQRVARLLRQGHQPRFKDLFLGITEATPGIWFLTFILCICYMIWVTDALVIYGLYFGVQTISLSSDLFTDPELRDPLISYLVLTGFMGMIVALIGFAVGAFSIPLILHQKQSFVTAVHTSVVTVFKHPALMLRWAFTLAAMVMLTLALALPLLVIVLPVTAYASYAAYAALLQPDTK